MTILASPSLPDNPHADGITDGYSDPSSIRHLRIVGEDEPTYDAPARRGHITMLEDDVVDEVLFRCGPAAAGIYLYLDRRANKQGKCWPSLADIATSCSTTERYVRELINEKLVPAGFVLREELTNRFGRTQGVEYTLPYHHSPRNHGAERTPEPGPERTPEPGPEPDRQTSSSKVVTGSSREVERSSSALPANGPAQQIVKAYCEAVGIAQPGDYGKAVGVAQKLAKGGLSPTEVGQMVRWLQHQTWVTNGITLQLMLRTLDQWLPIRSTWTPPYRPADSKQGVVVG